MTGISKSFPGVKALEKVDLQVKTGTVHALMGENGAGKSTLMKILIGLYHQDSGKIEFDGKEVEIPNVNFALKSGISMIFQELNPIMNMTVAENIYVGREPLRKNRPLVDMVAMNCNAAEHLKKLEMDSTLKPTDKLKNLTVAKMQMVEISKALSYGSKLIVMDEPTSALSEKECDHLFRIVENLKKEGVAFIFITHKLDEVFKIADEVTIMRDGKLIVSESINNVSKKKLIDLMVGREITQLFPRGDPNIGDKYFEVKGLSKNGLFNDVSFSLHRGEIVGLAGLMGAGRTELVETIFGYRKADSGTISIGNKPAKIKSPADAIGNKIALITEDRKLTGLYLPLNVKENMILPTLGKFMKGPFLDNKRIKEVCEEEVRRYKIKTPTINQVVNNLSGGNQQKVLVARWLLTDPDIIILDEPTRGIDVGSKSEIHKIMSGLASQGKCILMISSEMPEIIGMSDRVIVMHEGRISGEVGRKEATQTRILELASGIA